MSWLMHDFRRRHCKIIDYLVSLPCLTLLERQACLWVLTPPAPSPYVTRSICERPLLWCDDREGEKNSHDVKLMFNENSTAGTVPRFRDYLVYKCTLNENLL
jgi:hypothetical protein